MAAPGPREEFFASLDALRQRAQMPPVQTIAREAKVPEGTVRSWFPVDPAKERTVARSDEQLIAVVEFLTRRAGGQYLDRRAREAWSRRRAAAATRPDESIAAPAPTTEDGPPGAAVLEALSRDSARLFVDVMRLLTVRSSTETARANADGVSYFKELATRHRSDLREDLTRAGRDLPAVEPFGRIEAALTWSMWTLDDPRSHAALSDDAIRHQLAETAEILAEVLDRSGTYQAERRAAETAVAAALESPDPVLLPHGPRGRAQSGLLDRRDRTGRRLRSVQEDVGNELGIPYFWIDHLLLQRWRATKGTANSGDDLPHR
ncbi:hypothetical protein [Nocardia niwae]|uniref:hypothetical protein n=1 Tax=Nocardia niwae TaxID=626084 RepID=UPI003407933D